MKSPVIGIDFDNTLVTYDDVLRDEAIRQGFLSVRSANGKKEIRDVVRALPGGELKWRKLQAMVYGLRMGEARLAQGVERFLKVCRKHGAGVWIISHKTKHAAADPGGVDLRKTAMNWMESSSFFGTRGLGLSREQVSFHSTRHEKIDRIRRLGCTHFIDDLEETFQEPSFPATVEKILYAPHRQKTDMKGVRVTRHWDEISEYLFDGDR